MQFLEQEILDITEATWQSLLGLDIRMKKGVPSPSGVTNFLTGQVGISGEWNGLVRLHGSDTLAQAAACVVFNKNADDVTEQDQLDTIYELSNIIAGNIKSLLPEPCALSLPDVGWSTINAVDATAYVRVSELLFECQGQPLYVILWQSKEES